MSWVKRATPSAANRRPGHHDQPGPHVRHQPAGDLRGGQRVHGHQREEGDAGLERREVVDGLEQVGEEQEGPEHPGDGQQNGQERARPVPVAQHAQREEGVGALALPQDERTSEHAGGDQGRDDVGGAPPAGAGLTEPVAPGPPVRHTRGRRRARPAGCPAMPARVGISRKAPKRTNPAMGRFT